MKRPNNLTFIIGSCMQFATIVNLILGYRTLVAAYPYFSELFIFLIVSLIISSILISYWGIVTDMAITNKIKKEKEEELRKEIEANVREEIRKEMAEKN